MDRKSEASASELTNKDSEAAWPPRLRKRLWKSGKAISLAKKASVRTHILKTFSKTAKDNVVDREDFLSLSSKLEFKKVSEDDWASIADAFGEDDKNAKINILDFAIFVATPSAKHGSDASVVQKATEKLRKGIADQLEKENSPKQKFKSANEFMRKKFKAGGGNLTKGTMKSKKFQAALSKVSPSSKLSTGELNAVTKRFSVDDTTTSFVDFMYFIDPSPDVERLLKKLKIKEYLKRKKVRKSSLFSLHSSLLSFPLVFLLTCPLYSHLLLCQQVPVPFQVKVWRERHWRVSE